MVFNEWYIMKEYYFITYDYVDGAHIYYDIKGDDLQELINVCVKYCTVLSLTYWPGQESVREKFRKYELSEEESRPFAAVATWRAYNDDFTTVNIFYRICPELIDEFLKMSDGRLTGWCRFEDENYPEDPSFFREDASVFFNPVVHEGLYFLHPRDDEDVSNIVCHPGWCVNTRGNKLLTIDFDKLKP